MNRVVLFLGILGVICSPVLAAERPPTLERLLADLESPGYQTRRRAVLACEGRAEAELLDRLLDLVRTDAHPNIRGYAAETLATYDDPRVFDTLREVAGRESYGVVCSAYVALGKHGDTRALPILLAGLERGRGLRGYAAKGLGLLGDPSAFQPLMKVYLANLEDPYLHDLGATALFALDSKTARASLLPRWATMPSPARYALARTLGEHSAPEVTKAVLAHLGAEDRDLRAAVLLVLRLGRDRTATPALVAHLGARPSDADATIDALGEIGDPLALAPLLAVLERTEVALTKLRTIRALARVGDRRAVSALVRCLDDPRSTPQPVEISSIWTFPYNSRVDAGAVWAIRSLVDGAEPFSTTEISRFRNPHLPSEVAAEIPRIKDWWKALENRAPYSFAR